MSDRPLAPATGDEPPDVLWSPAADARAQSRMGRYLDWLGLARGIELGDYEAAWRWSVGEPGAFWQSVWDHFDVGRGVAREGHALADGQVPITYNVLYVVAERIP